MPIVSRVRTPLIVAAASLIVSLSILAVMLWKAEILVRLGFVGYLWYVLLLLMGLAVAVCLFALFESYARYSGKAIDWSLEIGGPAVLMLVVIVLGFLFVPMPSARFDLTVFVHGESGREALALRNRGALLLDLGADRRREAIGDKGEVRFVGIPADQRGNRVPVILEAEGFELAQADAHVTLNSEVAYLKVRAKPLRLVGVVFDDAFGQPLAGARLSLANRTAITDADGRFDFSLPGDLPEHDRTLTITAAGYAAWRGQVTPGGNPLVVQLSRVPKR